jgi:hypothetical protein
MAKANLTLPNGTKVSVEGSPDEVKQLLEFYGGANSSTQQRSASKKKSKKKGTSTTQRQSDENIDISEVVNLVKSCEEAEQIETQILDRTSQVDRTLLPLYIVHEHLDNSHGLTSGDISRITTDLGIPIATANASRVLSNTASKYVIGDKVRKKGQPVKYKLSRRGIQYIKGVITSNSSDN